MLSGLSEILRVLGLSTPFVYAAAVFGFFRFLDKKASGQAKRSLSSWLKPLPYDHSTVVNVLLEAFDNLYTKPLLGWRAIVRSMCFTAVIFAICIYEYVPEAISYPVIALISFVTNSVSDYLSLFALRKWLTLGGRKPLIASVVGFFMGAATIGAIYSMSAVITALVFRNMPYSELMPELLIVRLIGFWKIAFGLDPEMKMMGREIILAAFVVHLWLILLAIGMVFIEVLNRLLWATGKMQWFLKQGQHHPLEAIGYVAGGVVFSLAATVHWVIR
jgi:hypothetical protein